jgi:hypothetical protein
MSQDKNFKVGDIICMHYYPGRDHWQTVGEVIGKDQQSYHVRLIQSSTSSHGWQKCVSGNGAFEFPTRYLSRGGYEEAQTTLFSGKTIEDEEREKEAQARQKEIADEARIREIVKEEIANFYQNANFCLEHSSDKMANFLP